MFARRPALLRLLPVAMVLGALVIAAPASAAKPPKLTVPQAKLDAAYNCPIPVKNAKRVPVMFVTGTGASGDEGYAIGQDAFEAYGHPVCYVNFPDFTTADIQVSVQYLVNGIRREFRESGRPIAIVGISQGGLLPRIALTYWTGLQPKVADVVSFAGSHHGTNVAAKAGDPCTAANPCTPASWQQSAGSNLLKAINSQPDETPGDTSWTTVRSLTDETVQPQSGPHPSSALEGATNIVIQNICPGRTTTHIGTALDSVSFAAFEDAVANKGAAKVSRLPKNVCDHPYGPGLDEAKTTGLIAAGGGLTGGRGSDPALQVTAEPKVRAFYKRIAK